MHYANPSLAYERTFAAVVGLFTNAYDTATDERLRDTIIKVSQITGLTPDEQARVFVALRENTTFFGR